MLPLKLRKFDIHHITCGRGGRKGGAFPAFCQYSGGILSFNLCKWCEHSLKSELGLSYDTCHMTWWHHKNAPLKLVWSPPGSLLWFSSFWVDPWLSLLFVLVLGVVFQNLFTFSIYLLYFLQGTCGFLKAQMTQTAGAQMPLERCTIR